LAPTTFAGGDASVKGRPLPGRAGRCVSPFRGRTRRATPLGSDGHEQAQGRASSFLRPALFPSVPALSRSRLLAVAFAATMLCCAPAVASAQTDRRAPARAHPKRTLGERAAALAVREVGVPYRWGGTSPASGFDCSGLVYWAYGRLGLELPHSSYALYGQGRPVRRSRMKPGDLLFFYGLGHVGIYVGRGRMVHAPHSGTRVQVVSLRRSAYGARLVGIRRMMR
jgi:cell wall-associated NlpC family hydrolase